MCSCILQMLSIFVKLMMVIFGLLSYSFVVQTAADQLGSRLALGWVAFLFATSMWYNCFAPYMLPARRQSRRTKSLLTALNYTLAPIAVGSVAVVCGAIAQKNMRIAGLDAVLLIIMELGTRYVVTSATSVKRISRKPVIEQEEEEDDDNDDEWDGSRQHVDGTRMLNFQSGRFRQTKPNANSVAEKYGYGRTRKHEMIVMIEGPICAGKTTLCKNGVNYLTGEFRVVPEDVHASLHAAFVEQPAKYGFTLQMVMRERRDAVLATQRVNTPVSNKLEQCIVAVDRSVIGDFAFLLWNYIEGSISDEELQVYCNQYGSTPVDSLKLQPHVKYAIAMVFSGSNKCHERLAQRVGVDQGAPLHYLQGLEIAHAMCAANVIRAHTNVAVHLLNGRKERTTQVDCIKLAGKLCKKNNSSEDIEFDDDAAGQQFEFTNMSEKARYAEMCRQLAVDDLVPLEQVCEEKWRAALMAIV